MAGLKDGMTVMIGGFMNVGTPQLLVDALVESGVKNLTIIANDTGFPGKGVGRLIDAGVAARVIASHIGTNPVTGKLMLAGELAVDLIPQGTLVERIRCGGAGLGGFLTPTGFGTVVAEGKEILSVEGRQYLLEKPLKADLALVKAVQADTMGNLKCRRAARNFNPIIATAADRVVAEVDQVVEVGELDPDDVTIPGIFINAVVINGDAS